MKRPTLKKYVNGTWIVGSVEEEEPKQKKKQMNSCVNPIQNINTKKIDFLAALFSKENIFAIIYGGILGTSIALNIYQYTLLKAYLKIMMGE